MKVVNLLKVKKHMILKHLNMTLKKDYQKTDQKDIYRRHRP